MVGEGGGGDAVGEQEEQEEEEEVRQGQKRRGKKVRWELLLLQSFPSFFSSIFAPVEKGGGKGDLIPIRKALVNLLQQKERRGERKSRKDFFSPSKEWKRKSV